MGIVFVRRIVADHHIRRGGQKQPAEIFTHILCPRVFDGRSGMIQHDERPILTDHGRFLLLPPADSPHLPVGEPRVPGGTGTARAVGHDDACEPPVGPAKAIEDRMRSHDLDVVGVRGNAHRGRARKSLRNRHAVGDEYLSAGTGKFHVIHYGSIIAGSVEGRTN